jgi:hypothetical protein
MVLSLDPAFFTLLRWCMTFKIPKSSQKDARASIEAETSNTITQAIIQTIMASRKTQINYVEFRKLHLKTSDECNRFTFVTVTLAI